LVAVFHVQNQVQLHDVHESVEELFHADEHEVVATSHQFVQVIPVHDLVVLVEARRVRFAEWHHDDEVQEQAAYEDLEHRHDYEDVC
jgi:hypothetical protein